MKLISWTITRNSDWILEATITAAMMYCDEAVILNHASTDGTAEAIHKLSEKFPGKIHVLYEKDPVWNEMNHRQRCLVRAREVGGTHFANVDDDEIITANIAPHVRGAAKRLKPGEAVDTPWLSIWDGLTHYRNDRSHWSDTFVSFIFADKDGMIFCPGPDGYQHHNRRPTGSKGPVYRVPDNKANGGMFHFQFASRRRLHAKQALYKMWEVIRWPKRAKVERVDILYSGTALDVPSNTTPIPDSWWKGMENIRDLIDLEAVPWQEAECQRLWDQHGPDKFRGLNLFGVIKQ